MFWKKNYNFLVADKVNIEEVHTQAPAILYASAIKELA